MSKLKLQAPRERKIEIELPEGVKAPKGSELTPEGEYVLRVKNLTMKEQREVGIQHKAWHKDVDEGRMEATDFLFGVIASYCTNFPREFYDQISGEHAKQISEMVTALVTGKITEEKKTE